MWTAAARRQHSRDSYDYPSSLTDAEWERWEPLLPSPATTGRPRRWRLRAVFDGVLYVLRYGIPWRALPLDFPPWQTVYRWFRALVAGFTFERANHAMVASDRLRAGREAQPTAGVMDSQSVKATETPSPRSYDGGKKINGQKRHILVDTDGRLLLVGLSGARLHDSRGGAILVGSSRRSWPFLELVFADSAYAGAHVADASPHVRIDVVKADPGQKGFAVQRRRWVVERTFAWLGRSRRLWRCCDTRYDVATSFVYAAAATLLVRRIARSAS